MKKYIVQVKEVIRTTYAVKSKNKKIAQSEWHKGNKIESWSIEGKHFESIINDLK